MLMRWMRSLFAAHPHRFKPQPAAVGRADVLLLASGDNASIAYLVEPYLGSLGLTSVRIDVSEKTTPDIGETDCHTVVVVRYLPSRCVAALRSLKRAGKRIVYFMDDDLMDPSVATDLPRAYARKIRLNATRQRQILEELCDEFWVATAFLANKYESWSPRLLSARPGARYLTSLAGVSVFYHGSASHHAELVWLAGVMAKVQATTGATHFEVFGDQAVNRLYRNIPRAAVVHPMGWPNYLSYTAAVSRDIGLAPLLPNSFNAGRGPTKFFDFTRMGAVGIYANVAPYNGFIRDGIDGMLLPLNPELWVEAILSLAHDEPRRKRMALAARERALSMAWDTDEQRLAEHSQQL